MRNRLQTQAGYSLIELMLVVGIMGVVTGIAVVQIGASKQGLNGDGAMRVVLSQLNQAKELAITQRRNMRLTFDNNNSVQILREEVPAGGGPTPISSVPFEGGLQFLRTPALGQPELPALPAAVAVAFGGATEIKFAPDGTLIDQDGVTLNGTLFMALPGQLLSTRAVTVFGSTGRIRGYRWNGIAWTVV
jgi:prepilin-type N-terminal cleavage/methylation domain-containing protein